MNKAPRVIVSRLILLMIVRVIVVGVLINHASASTRGGQFRTQGPDGKWEVPDERVYFGEEYGKQFSIDARVAGQTVSCPLAYQDVAYVLGADRQRIRKVSVSAYKGCPFTILDELEPTSDMEMREPTTIEIVRVADSVFWLSPDSALPLVAEGSNLRRGETLVNMTWSFKEKGGTFDTKTARYLVDEPGGTIRFTQNGIVMSGVRKMVFADPDALASGKRDSPTFSATNGEARATFILNENAAGHPTPYYLTVVQQSTVSGMSPADQGRLVVIDGQIRMQHREAVVDLSQRPAGLESFRTAGQWVAAAEPPGSSNLWRIRADGESPLEMLYDIEGGVHKPLYLAPGFSGRLHLARGETALVFGTQYTAAEGQTLVVSWDGVEVVPDPVSLTPTVLVFSAVATVVAVGFLVVRHRRRRGRLTVNGLAGTQSAP